MRSQKPFVYDELVPRMRAVLRRCSGPEHARLTIRDLEIDLAARIAPSRRVQLSTKELRAPTAAVSQDRGFAYERYTPN